MPVIKRLSQDRTELSPIHEKVRGALRGPSGAREDGHHGESSRTSEIGSRAVQPSIRTLGLGGVHPARTSRLAEPYRGRTKHASRLSPTQHPPSLRKKTGPRVAGAGPLNV